MSDASLEKYIEKAVESGATHAKQIHPSSVVTAPWVRWKCRFGCDYYDKGYLCPPYSPTPEETRAVLDCYQRAILFHVEAPRSPERGGRQKLFREFHNALIDLEGEMFKDGYYRAFVLLAGPCTICKECAKLKATLCNFPLRARPSMEACGIDVYQTARTNGFFIVTLREKTETQNCYYLMLVD